MKGIYVNKLLLLRNTNILENGFCEIFLIFLEKRG